MRHLALVSAALAATLPIALTAADAATRFDGNWSVEVITERGDCDKAYRYPIAIEDGRVRYAGPGSFVVAGGVSGNGAVNGSISHGERTAQVKGSLSGTSGGGRWSTASCSGRWVGERRS